jgi:hypothetical protein
MAVIAMAAKTIQDTVMFLPRKAILRFFVFQIGAIRISLIQIAFFGVGLRQRSITSNGRREF